MALHLTSCERAREPGFSRSECLDLARQIDQHRTLIAIEGQYTPSPRQRDTIVAALRAYAA